MFIFIEHKINQNWLKYNIPSYQQIVVAGKIVYRYKTETNFIYIIKTANKKICLYCNNEEICQKFAYGDKVKLLCEIKDVSLNNKYEMYIYYAFGVEKIGYILQVISCQPSRGLVYKFINKLDLVSSVIREYIVNLVNTNISSPANSVILRLTLGYTDYELKEIKNYFQDAGVAHVLVVSGLHVGFVYLFVSFLTKFIFRSIVIRKILGLFFTTFFATVVGFTPPVARATVIVCCVAIYELLQRKHSVLHSLILSAMLILFVSPFNLFSGSFQLTYAASFGILYVYNFLYNNVKSFIESKKQIIQYIIKLFLTTTSAQLMVIPLIMYYFNKISVVSFMSNIIVIPFSFVLLCIALMCYILNFLLGGLCTVFWQGLQTMAFVYINIVKFFSKIPFSCFNIPTPPINKILLYYLLLLFMMRIKNIVYFSVVALISTLFLCTNLTFKKFLNTTFFDVDLGDSILITTPENKTVLIDTADSENKAKYIIVPSLYKNGIRYIDYLIITHFHYPHYGGLKYILENFVVKNLYIPNFLPYLNSEYKDILNTAVNKDVNLVVVNSTKTIKFSTTEIKVVPNFEPYTDDKILMSDFNSLMLSVEYKNYVVVLTNDVPAKFGLYKMIKNIKDKHIIIQLPRHGKYVEDLAVIKQIKNSLRQTLFFVVSTDKLKFNKKQLKYILFPTYEYGNLKINFEQNYRIKTLNFNGYETIIRI